MFQIHKTFYFFFCGMQSEFLKNILVAVCWMEMTNKSDLSWSIRFMKVYRYMQLITYISVSSFSMLRSIVF